MQAFGAVPLTRPIMKLSNRTARNKTPLYRRVLRSSWIQEAVKMTSGTPAEPCPCAWNLCCSIRDRPEADRRTAVPADLLSSEFQLFEIITIGEDSATPCRSSRSCELPRQPLERAAIFEHGCGVSPRQLLRPTADKATEYSVCSTDRSDAFSWKLRDGTLGPGPFWFHMVVAYGSWNCFPGKSRLRSIIW